MRQRPMNFTVATLLTALVATALAGDAEAVVVINNLMNVAPEGGEVHASHDPSTSGSPDLITASSSDLIHGLLPTVTYTGGTGNTMFELSAGESVWTDGLIATVYGEGGSGGDDVDHAAYGAVTGTVGGSPIHTFVTYDLGELYDLTQVDVFMGWNDSGRDDASFMLNVSSNGTNFLPIIDYDKGGDNTGAITTPITHLHSIVDDGGASIAPAPVRYVQLQFTDADNGTAGMVELDVFGDTPDFDAADADRNGVVDINDFILISDNFLSVPSSPGLDGDIVIDNFVDAADFRLWKDYPGMAEALAAYIGQPVPEPATVALLGLAALFGWQMRVGRKA